MESWEMKACISAILVAADEPVNLETMAKGMRVTEIEVEDALREYEADLMAADQGFQVRHRAGGVRLEVKPQYSDVIGSVLPKWRQKELSNAATWTLAFIALQQPVTIGEINVQRNVTNSSSVVQTLVDRELVARHPKRGSQHQKFWGTTQHFLDVHGLKSIDEFREKGTKERIFPDIFNDDSEEVLEEASGEIEEETEICVSEE